MHFWIFWCGSVFWWRISLGSSVCRPQLISPLRIHIYIYYICVSWWVSSGFDGAFFLFSYEVPSYIFFWRYDMILYIIMFLCFFSFFMVVVWFFFFLLPRAPPHRRCLWVAQRSSNVVSCYIYIIYSIFLQIFLCYAVGCSKQRRSGRPWVSCQHV